MTEQHSVEWHALQRVSLAGMRAAEGDPTGIDVALANGNFTLRDGRAEIYFGSIPPETIEQLALRRVSGAVVALETERVPGWTAEQLADFNAEIAPVDAAKAAAEAAIALDRDR